MGEKRPGMCWLPLSVGAMVLTAAVLFGSAYGAAASTAYRGILLPGHPARSMAPGTPLFAGVCGPVPTDSVFTWAKAKKLLHIR
jgi:hypothetical protein